MSADLLPFRRKATPVVWSDGRIQTECDDRVHLFESVPGRCQCGERLWETLEAPAEDGGNNRSEKRPSDSQ